MSVNVPKIMLIDLTNETIEVLERGDLVSYLGGVSMGVQLLKEYGHPKENAFSPEQPIIFTRGPLNTIFPVVTKTCAIFKSPLTEELGESYAGLRLSMAMGMAGLMGIVIKGKANKPVVLNISNDTMKIKDANALWGLNTDEATRLLHDDTGRRGLRSIMVIGESGEKLIRYSCVTVDSYRHFGRLGLGAVLGSKMVKGIVIEGDIGASISNPRDYQKVYEEIYQKVNETELMEKYHGIGTSININALNDLKALPTHNFQQNHFDMANEISGEHFAENHLVKKIACSGCTIGCIHIALLRQKFGDSHEYHSSTVAYDHELIFALGTMLGIGNAQEVLMLIEEVEMIGYDVMSVGVLMSWLTEAYEKKIITSNETICSPEFGNAFVYREILRNIVQQPNEFYKLAGLGTDALAKKYGGRDFAMVLGKNEVAGYHTGYGNLMGQTVGARHSHLDNAGYSFDQGGEVTKEELVDKLIQEETDRNLLNSLVICLFARKIYDYETVVKALNTIGYEVTEEELRVLAKKTFIEKIKLKEEMGFSYEELTFPKRFFEVEGGGKKLNLEDAQELLNLYIKKIDELR